MSELWYTPPVPPSPLRWFREAIAPVGPRERDILTILALHESARITAFVEALGLAGIRETPTRQLSGTTLRPLLDDLEKRDLLTSDGQTWRIAPYARHSILRLAHISGRLAVLAPRPVIATGKPREGIYRDLHAFLARLGPETAGVVERAAAEAPDLLATVALSALTTPFDGAWFEAIPAPVRPRILAPALAHAETIAAELGPLGPALAARLDEHPPEVLAPLAGLALLKGDLALVRRIEGLLGGAPQRVGVAGSLALVEGRLDEAAERFCPPKKSPPPQAGVASVLQVLALLHRAAPGDLDAARRLAKVGAGKKHPFRRSHAVLALLAEAGADPGRPPQARDLVLDPTAEDCLWPLLGLFVPLWFPVTDADAAAAFAAALPVAARLRDHDLPWLADELADALHALAARHPRAVPGDRRALPTRGRPAIAPPLAALRGIKEAWETSLEGLDRLAEAAAPEPEADDEAGAERLFYRVFPLSGHVEPHVQRRRGGGWTEGRRLAIKHLLDRAFVDRLPAEDAVVAAFAREERHLAMGYPHVEHVLDRAAIRVLVGHPRVYLEHAATPIEVVEGQVHLAVRAEDAGLSIRLAPEGLHHEHTAIVEEGRLVVYTISEALRPVVKLVGQGLTVPSAGRARALDTLGRLARILPVQSTEPTTARNVAPDARPWVRLTPHQGGLHGKLSCRPLGAEGPEMAPGQGAPTLLSRVRGEAVQTERDLAAERRAVEEVLAACELRLDEGDERSFTVPDPEACLALVSALRELGDRVHVEWPQGRPLRLRARVGRRALRGSLRFDRGHFLAAGSLAVDDELGLGLGELLSLVAERPGRFVRLDNGDYLELEQELREVLEVLATVRAEARPAREAVAIPAGAIGVLERLGADDGGLALDARTRAFRERIVEAFSRTPEVPRGLEAELRSYQREGFVWLARLSDLDLGACLADDMGLGKTVQLVALLLHRARAQRGPALVVAPTSVCDNWRQEITRFAPSLGVRVYAGPKRDKALADLGSHDVVIASYGLLQQDAAALQQVGWGTAVLDEAQLVKNAESQRAQAAFGLQAAMRVAATGTPVENHIGDLHSIFRFLMPGLLGPWGELGPRVQGEGATTAAARRALRRLIQPFVLRRTKAQVLDDLPPLTEIRHTVTLSEAEAHLYEGVRRKALERLSGAPGDPGARIQVLAEITRLRRLCCHPALVAPEARVGSSKLAAFVELMEELVEGHHRALVFSQFVDVLRLAGEMLRERGISYQYLDGSTPAKQRAAAAQAFQAGEGDAFLISLKAGGLGLNLTAADYVIHLDPWWNPAVESQASDRAYRLGQTRPVTVYRLVTAGTVEERIVDLHRVKRELAESLLEGTERVATLSAEELRGLLEEEEP